MPLIEREVLTDTNGYKEVSLDYRIARAKDLDLRRISERGGRIACPGLDASRNDVTYGVSVLQGGESAHLKAWADALGVNSIGIKMVAYLSGPLLSTPIAFLKGRFDDRLVNSGFLRSLKHSTNTGILEFGRFDQAGLDAFVWSVRPDLRGTPMTPDWLYDERSACEYIDASLLPAIRVQNARNSDPRAGWFARRLGLFLSTFEIENLLLGTLGQSITIERSGSAKTLSAIHLRDLHDLYKYGLFPAVAEDQLVSARLLILPDVPVHSPQGPAQRYS